MIGRDWQHGHSLGAGVLGGLLLASHAWTVAVLAFAGGLLVGAFWQLLQRGAGALHAWAGKAGHQEARRPRPRLFDQEADPETFGRTPW